VTSLLFKFRTLRFEPPFGRGGAEGQRTMFILDLLKSA